MTDQQQIAVISNGKQQLPATHSTQVQAIAAAEEIRCLFLAAMQCPRNLAQVKADVIEACQDRDLAEEALYSYRRGSQLVEGPSIDLIEEIASIFGRIKAGWEVVEEAQGRSKVRAYAIDIEKLHPDERSFWVEHVRETKDGKKPLTDSRDIYELIANMAQRRKRACIEALIPKSIISAAVRQIAETLKAGGTEPLEKRAVTLTERLIKAFAITEQQIEKFLGSKVHGMTETQYVRLIAIGKSIKDGAPIAQFFPPIDTTPKAAEPEAEKKAEPAAAKPKGKGGKPPKPQDATAAPADSTQAVKPTSDSATPAEPPTLVEPDEETGEIANVTTFSADDFNQ